MGDETEADMTLGTLQPLPDAEAFTKVVEALPDVDQPINRDHWTLLVHASRVGNLDAAKILLDKGASPDHATRDGFTPLIAAVANGSVEIVQLLLDKNADINKSAPWGATALNRACTDGRNAIAWTLIEAGATVDLESSSGDTALMAAAGHAHQELVALLLTNGADINLINKRGFTALMRATFNGHKSMVEYLLSKGALVNANKKNLTAIQIAQRKDDRELADILERALAKERRSLSTYLPKFKFTWDHFIMLFIAVFAIAVGLVIQMLSDMATPTQPQ